MCIKYDCSATVDRFCPSTNTSQLSGSIYQEINLISVDFPDQLIQTNAVFFPHAIDKEKSANTLDHSL
jgi:hypothetical protein